MSTTERPREIDILEYMKDECELNSWESTFVPSCIAWLRKSSSNRLSVKQAAKMNEMFKDYRLEDHVKQGYLVRGYADRTDQEVISPPQTRGIYDTSRQERNKGFDDLDDDIPF